MKKVIAIMMVLGSAACAKAQTIESGSHGTVGYIKSDGTIENSSHGTVGYVKSDGTVENSSHGTIGYARGIKKEWAAVTYFFFKF